MDGAGGRRMSNDKSPVRIEVERQILAALSESDRPMTLRELAPIADAAEGPQQLARILGYMRRDGMIVNGPEVHPGEPGGLSGKGARVVASYQLNEDCVMNSEPAILQGKSADIDLIAALKMSAAEDDAESSGHVEIQADDRVGIEFERDVLVLREIAEHAALDAADALIRNSPVRAWEAMLRVHRAVVGFSEDYV
jgi:hypothetical protein